MAIRLMWISETLLPSPFGRGAGGEGFGQGQPMVSNTALTLTLSQRARGLMHALTLTLSQRARGLMHALTLTLSQRARGLPHTLHLMLALLLTLLTGCGGGPKPLPVSGVVTLDGQPVADAGVMFCPAENGPMASGTTDAKGKFQLKTTNALGAMAGQYRVAISKKEESGPTTFGVVDPRRIKVKWIIPQKYSNPETSGLKAAVGRDQSEFTFALVSQ